MLSVVAAKDGYPAEMVGLDMDLETDLGVDSIKRVEILSAVTEKAPGLPEVSAARMAGMRSLREMVAYLGEQAGCAAVASEVKPASVESQAPSPTQWRRCRQRRARRRSLNIDRAIRAACGCRPSPGPGQRQAWWPLAIWW